jgi:molybdopterin converting factor small subunit
MITVRLPAMLRADQRAEELRVEESVANVGQLVAALERLRPDLRDHLHDSLYNFAVNDALVLHGADDYPLNPGDVVEVIPTIAGG